MLTNLQFYVKYAILYIATENFLFQILHIASRKCDNMIGSMPVVTAFDQKRMCFSVDIYETNSAWEEVKIGKASVILGKTEGDEPEVKFYQDQTEHTYLTDLAESCSMRSDETYLQVTRACIYASKAIWGY